MKQCAPDIGDSLLTCFSYSQLKNIAINYNTSLSKTNKAVTNSHKLNPEIKLHNNKKRLWNSIYDKMKYQCNNEKCWIDKSSALTSKHTYLNNFRPDTPSVWKQNPAEWLTNHDIQAVMIQYEKKYRNFKFIGVFPIDFDHKIYMNTCVSQELCNLDINQLGSRKQLGVIFNTDKHDAAGSHWVAVYIGLNPDKQFGFFYYDSNANLASPYIIKLYNKLKKQLQPKLKNKFKMFTNNVKHQFKNSECGMFSMHFLINMMENKDTFVEFINKPINDSMMADKRKIYYYPSSGGKST